MRRDVDRAQLVDEVFGVIPLSAPRVTREVSRFARYSRDWQQLIEMCRVVNTVLIDQETIYAPRHGNDRLCGQERSQKGFRRLKAYKQLPALRLALAAYYEKETNNRALVQIAKAA